jgi:hypothetical protein
MAFKMNYKGFPKRKVKSIEPQVEPSIFDTDPYSKSSMSRQVVDKMYDNGGKTQGLESKLTFNQNTNDYTRTQVESSPAYLKKKKK